MPMLMCAELDGMSFGGKGNRVTWVKTLCPPIGGLEVLSDLVAERLLYSIFPSWKPTGFLIYMDPLTGHRLPPLDPHQRRPS